MLLLLAVPVVYLSRYTLSLLPKSICFVIYGSYVPTSICFVILDYKLIWFLIYSSSCYASNLMPATVEVFGVQVQGSIIAARLHIHGDMPLRISIYNYTLVWENRALQCGLL